MAQYPVESNEQLFQAVNYLLSGPGGLGQNFAGFSDSGDAYITGNFRKPYTQLSTAALYVPAISLSSAEMLDNRTFKYTFTSPQPSPPFSIGNGLSISGFTDNIYNTYPKSNTLRNTNLSQIGVVECTTTYVIIRSVVSETIHAPESTSASVFYYSTQDIGSGDPFTDSNFIGTDNDVRVNVTGGTDRIFVSGQLDLTLSYETTTSCDLYVVVEIDRYRGIPNNDPTNPDFLFFYDQTSAYKIYTFSVSAGTATLPPIETYFTSVVDSPPSTTDPLNPWIGFYRYIMNVGLASNLSTITDAQFTTAKVGLRSLSAQVVKQ